MVTAMKNFFKHLKIIRTHRKFVRKACFDMGLFWQGLTHDLSKYSFTEMKICKYYTGKKVITKNTYSIHHYSASWTSAKSKRTLLIKRIIGVKLYNKLYGKFLHKLDWLEW